jgi:thiol:disulfide interchange protein DsbD
MQGIFRLILILCSVAVWASPAPAFEQSAALDNTTVTLASETSTIAAGQDFWLLFTVEPRQGWHTYWYNPGDSGLGLSLEWTHPEGFTIDEPLWPMPTLIDVEPLVNYGYDGISRFPIKVHVPDALAAPTVTFTVNASWLVCDDICIPEAATLHLTLDVGENQAPIAKVQQQLNSAFRSIPEPFTTTITHAMTRSRSVISLPTLATDGLIHAYLFHNDALQFQHTLRQDWQVDGTTGLAITLPRHQAEGQGFSGVLHLMYNNGEERAFNLEAPLPTLMTERDAPTLPTDTADLGLITALVFAFLGGLILNLMPCVFPVISLKLFALLKGQQHATHVRYESVWYSIGVLVSFAALAGVLLVLQQLIGSVGWGFQLQSPLFIAALIFVFFLIGLNLFGMFALPSVLANTGQRVAHKTGWLAPFATGVLAVMVATPCTAPFMAPALWFAFAQPAPVTIAVMLAMGVGFAGPYLVLAAYPAAARYFPKPGAWLVRFKQFMAFPMFATVIWLLTVLVTQTSVVGLFIMLVALLLLVMLFWLWAPNTGKPLGLPWRVLWWAALLLVLLGSVQQLPRVEAEAALSTSREAFSRERLEAALAEGHPVFVNATADWCVTCKINEATTLNRRDVKEAFAAKNVIYLIADWTNKDDTLYTYLQDFQRNGVPLYVLYEPKQPPYVLPQILTPAIVKDALARLE